MDAYILIGEANTRKSSTVRCLTGVAKARICEVEVLTIPTPIRVFSIVQSLQEMEYKTDCCSRHRYSFRLSVSNRS